MTKLNQIIAIEPGVRNTTYTHLTEVHKLMQKPALLSGISRVYRPRDDEGERHPPESTRVQVRVEDALQDIAVSLSRLFDITATKDWANCHAAADIMVDGAVLLGQVPVVYLLFLEKQLGDIRALVTKLPAHDPADLWRFDPSVNCWRTDTATTYRTKKVPRNHVKAEATDRHPAQVDVYFEDVPIGEWSTVKYSGAIPAERQRELLDRVTKLQIAVKKAREEANTVQISDVHAGGAVLGWLFAVDSPLSTS